MKIIRPLTLTDAMMTASNVTEADYAAYAGGTTYTPNTRVIDPAQHKIYESLTNSAGLETLTLDVAPAIPWLPNWTLTGQTSLATCQVVEYLTALTYLVKNRSAAFTLGEVIGVTGTAVLLADQGAAKPTFAVAANVGHDPATDCARDTPLWWKEVSATNRWKAFDQKVGSQTSNADSITYQLTPGEVFDSIAFLNLDAVSVQITLTDPIEGVVYDEFVDLQTTVITGTSAVMDWYTYFFSSIVKITDFARLDIPPYLNAVLDITILYTGETAKVGTIVLGLQTTLGTTLYSPAIGIVDYSQKTIDDEGVYSVTPGAFSKTLEVDLKIPVASMDEVQNLFARYRATLLVFIGLENHSSMILYGKWDDFIIVLPNERYCECSMTIQGLT